MKKFYQTDSQPTVQQVLTHETSHKPAILIILEKQLIKLLTSEITSLKTKINNLLMLIIVK